jgi:DNA-binding response OmpR family regulator
MNPSHQTVLYYGVADECAATICSRLRSNSFRVIHALDPQQLFDATQTADIDIYVINGATSDEENLALCRAVRKLDAQRPMLMCCDDIGTDSVRNILTSGVQWYLPRPLNLYHLIGGIVRLLCH